MKILLVDDQGYNRELLRFIMEDENHYCVEASNGQEAIDIFNQHKDIDIILMDVNMPVMDGIEATRIISKEKSNRQFAIIFITAMDDGDMLTRCLNAGGDDFVPKPVNESVLIAKINAHYRSIDNHRQLTHANKQLDLHNSQVKREHDIVESVFKNVQSLAPTLVKNFTGYTSPMSMFNGDTMLSCGSPSGGAYFLVGDFTGHGLSAAIGSLPVMSIFYNSAKRQLSVSEIARDINIQLNKILPVGLFFCASIGHLDKDGEKLILWSGGMNDALVLDPVTKKVKPIAGDHMPLGIHKKSEFDDTVQIHNLRPGTRVYFYTDGVNEAHDENKNMFGEQRIEDIIETYDHTLEKNVIFHIVEQVNAHTQNNKQDDDITLLEISCGPCVHTDRKTGNVIDIQQSFHNVECFPWKLHIALESSDLKATDTVEQVMAFLGTIPGVGLHLDKIFTIFSELYNNALEHGLLNLSSSLKDSFDGFEQYYMLRAERLAALEGHKITVDIEFIQDKTNYICIKITDTGEGFNIQNVEDKLTGTQDAHGRGIGLVKQLCSSLQYTKKGTRVVANYHFAS